MPHIVLTDEQLGVYQNAEGTIEIRDPSGRLIGHMEPDFRPETSEEAQKRTRAYGPGIPGRLLSAMLRALDAEQERVGKFDRAYMERFLAKWRAEQGNEFPSQ